MCKIQNAHNTPVKTQYQKVLYFNTVHCTLFLQMFLIVYREKIVIKYGQFSLKTRNISYYYHSL